MIGAIVVFFCLGGLFLAYRGGRLPMVRMGAQASASSTEGLTDPPNWKVEPADPVTAGRSQPLLGRTAGSSVATVARYGSVDPSAPPLWVRRTGKSSPIAPTKIPQVTSIESPRATYLPNSVKQPNGGQQSSGGQQRIVRAAASPSLLSASGRTRTAPDAVVDQEHRDLLRHAQFLIKAGLAPVAKDPLQQILREVPGTPIAQEARRTLDTIRN
ncbi:MAG TPA: hypothetical protein VFG04_27415, partial [Planctomycetaceae bacterium]|nr:hypothetical protein [Planctomycetaceae bacterium]